jgi:RsiW-degrading membrane proteinase PrsW (M82 family)
LPGQLARKWGHPQAAAINVASWLGYGRPVVAAGTDLGLSGAASCRPGKTRQQRGDPSMIAVLLIIYTAIVLVLFKLKLVKPRPYPIALIVVAGIFIVGGVVVAWALSAPISPKLVTSQYVVQLVPYVKGQVKTVHAQANQPMKKGD